jgi:DNA-binding MarR family transcriptional regulator
MARGAKPKEQLIQELIRAFRESGNQDDAFDALAAQLLGVTETDLRCLNIIENAGGLTAGELAARSGLTGGAITGVLDRLQRADYAQRVADPADRRRIRVRVTPHFHQKAERIWGPMAADWHATLAKRFTREELERIEAFLSAINEVGSRQMDRLRAIAGP